MQKNIFEKNYLLLNEGQKKAVDKIYGPCMVVAGPGTWKTQIIALRTANIILKTWVHPSNILITTFTEAWVVAIKKRLEYFLWSDWYKVQVSTIHSFAQDVISNFPEKFSEFKAWTPIDEVDTMEMLSDILDEMIKSWDITVLKSENDNYFYLRDIKQRITTLKQEWVNYNNFETYIKKQEDLYAEELSEIKPKSKKYELTKLKQEKHISKLRELKEIYKNYNNKLRELSRYDFNDMINFVVEKFRTDDELKYHYAEKFQFIMLDEYQDTNNAQNEIINLILSVWDYEENNQKNIMVVWDDDQSIYRFQGANIENMLNFSTNYPDSEIIVLENNYRSNQGILDLCKASIENNKERLTNRIKSLKKNLYSSHPDLKDINYTPKYFELNSKEEEFSFLLQEVRKKLDSWVKKEEIAIIVRWNSEVLELSNFFEANWLSVVSKQNTNILKNEYINFIIKYLKVLKAPDINDSDFIDILRFDIFWLCQSDIFKISRYAYNKNYTRKFKLSIFEIFQDLEKLKEEIDFDNFDRLIEFRDNFMHLSSELSKKSFLDFFSYLIENSKIVEYVQKNWNFDDVEDIYTLFNKIKDFSLSDREFSLDKFLLKVELFEKYGFSIPRQILKKQKEWINILTAHSSKWLEYEVVFVSWLYTWNWDSKKVVDKLKLPPLAWKAIQEVSNPIEEERRLFFVACSRAKNELILTTSLSNWNKINLVSAFVKEVESYFEKVETDISKDNIVSSITPVIKNKMINYSSREFDYIEEFLENYKLSPTDLNIFLDDPLEFLNRVVFKYPFVQNNATIFGSVYHRVLELFYSKYKDEWKLPEKSYLTSTFKLLLDREILDPSDYELLLEKWINWLEGFYLTYKNNTRKIAYIEYNFRSKWITFNWVPITWKIDKIEIIWESSNSLVNKSGQMAFFKESVALIDYKTWKPKTIWGIKWLDKNWNKKPWEGKYFRQLLFYKLLCELDYDFSSKFDIWSLAIDFVEWKDWVYKYLEVDYTDDEFEDFKNELLDSRKKIKDIEFWKGLLT